MKNSPSTEEIAVFMRSNEFVKQITSIFEDMPEDVLSQLEAVHNRYEHLIDITSGVFAEDIVKQDRLDYPQYINKTSEGSIVFDDDDCTAFMSKLTGIPSLLCYLYIANDFLWTVASGFVEDSDETVSEYLEYLNPKLKDDAALGETISFLINKGVPGFFESK